MKAGHDGTWVAHPGLVPIAKEIFDEHMTGPNQIDRKREDVHVTAQDLLDGPGGKHHGSRACAGTSTSAFSIWNPGCAAQGCVPIYNLMEDAATAEICRAQVWQWVQFNAKLDDGRAVRDVLVQELIAEQVMEIRRKIGADRFDQGCYRLASDILEKLMVGWEFPEFLTLVAYDYLD